MDIKSIPFFNMVKVFLTEHMPLMRHNSTHTIRSYKNAINLFVEYLKSKNIDIKNITFDIITEEEVRNFLRWLETSKKNKSKRTIMAKVYVLDCALSKFFVNL